MSTERHSASQASADVNYEAVVVKKFVGLTVKPEQSKRPGYFSTYNMVMFEETDGTARSLAASQKTSRPWQVHSAGTSPATAGEQEHGQGKCEM